MLQRAADVDDPPIHLQLLRAVHLEIAQQEAAAGTMLWSQACIGRCVARHSDVLTPLAGWQHKPLTTNAAGDC